MNVNRQQSEKHCRKKASPHSEHLPAEPKHDCHFADRAKHRIKRGGKFILAEHACESGNWQIDSVSIRSHIVGNRPIAMQQIERGRRIGHFVGAEKARVEKQSQRYGARNDNQPDTPIRGDVTPELGSRFRLSVACPQRCGRCRVHSAARICWITSVCCSSRPDHRGSRTRRSDISSVTLSSPCVRA